MTDTSAHQPMSARGFLFDGEPTRGLGHAVRELGLARSALSGFRHLTGAALGAVDDQVAAAAEGLLDVDLGDVLVSGWRAHHALSGAARRTLAAPDSQEVVVLATHRVTSTHRPRVTLYVDEVRVTSFELELRLSFDLTGVAAVVAGGALVSLRGGDCLLAAELRLDGALLARRERRLDPGLVVRLARPVPLAGEPGRHAA